MTSNAGQLEGFSGDGGSVVSAESANFHGPQHGDSNRSSEGDDGACCWSIGRIFISIGFGSALGWTCSHCPTKWYFRAVIAWIWILAISVTAGLLLTMVFYTTATSTVSSGDMVPLLGKYDSSICQDVKFSTTKPVDIFVMNKFPSYSRNHHTQTFNFDFKAIYMGDYHFYYSFYLIKGSSVVIQITKPWCEQTKCIEAILFIIKGKSNFEIWKSSWKCKIWSDESCVDWTEWIGTGTMNYTLSDDSVDDDDEFFFVFANTGPVTSGMPPAGPISLNGSFSIDRVRYDVSEAVEKLYNKTFGNVKLTFGQKQFIVVVKSDDEKDEEGSTIEYKCEMRWALFVPSVVILPLLIGVGISFLLYRKSKITFGAGHLGEHSGGEESSTDDESNGFQFHGHHHGRIIDVGDNGSCNCSIGCIFTSIGSALGLFFCLKCSNWYRYLITWFCISAIIFTAWLSLTVMFYTPASTSASAGDMVPLHEKYDSSICKDVNFSSTKPVDIFLMNKYPSYSSHHYKQTFNFDKMVIEQGDFRYYGFYLLKGSPVVLHIKSWYVYGTELRLYVLKGKSNFEIWKSDFKCSSCVFYDTYIYARNNIMNYTIPNINEDGEYYFAFASTGAPSIVSLFGSFSINRVRYDVTGAVETLYNVTSQNVKLTFGQKQFIIVKNEEGSTIKYKCEMRWELFVSCVVILPLSLGIGISILLWWFCHNRNDESRPNDELPIIT